MQRLNIAHQERLMKWLADEATFRRNNRTSPMKHKSWR